MSCSLLLTRLPQLAGPALQQWWQRGGAGRGAQRALFVERAGVCAARVGVSEQER